MIKGYDFASVDGNVIDWSKVRASFVIARASYPTGSGASHDLAFAPSRESAHAAGITFGAYVILGWDKRVSPEDQVAAFARAYGDRRKGELPPSLDLEADSAAAVGRTPAECLDWAERAYRAMIKVYGVCMVYTSARVWSEVFGNASSLIQRAPLWLKVAYQYKARQPDQDYAYHVLPVHGFDAPWIVQYQGDAVHVPGFSRTVDCNYFEPRYVPTDPWMAAALNDTNGNALSVAEWQQANGLEADGIIGPKSFAILYASP